MWLSRCTRGRANLWENDFHKVGTDDRRVSVVRAGGLLDSCNSKHPHRAIAEGDQIVQVKRENVGSEAIAQEIVKAEGTLTIVFRKQAAVVGADQIVVAPALAGAPSRRVASIAPTPLPLPSPASDQVAARTPAPAA